MAKTKHIAKAGEQSALAKVRTGTAWFLQEQAAPTLVYEQPVIFPENGNVYPAQLILTLNKDTAFSVDAESEPLPDGRFRSRKVPSVMSAAAVAAGMKPSMMGDTAEPDLQTRSTFGADSLLGIDVSNQQSYVAPDYQITGLFGPREYAYLSRIEVVYPGSPLAAGQFSVLPVDLESQGVVLTTATAPPSSLSGWFITPLDVQEDNEGNFSIAPETFDRLGVDRLEGFVAQRSAEHEQLRLRVPREKLKEFPSAPTLYFYVSRYVRSGAGEGQLKGFVIRTKLRPRVMQGASTFRGRLPVVLHVPFYVQRVNPVAPVAVTTGLYVDTAIRFMLYQGSDKSKTQVAFMLAQALLGYAAQSRAYQKLAEEVDLDDPWEALSQLDDPDFRQGWAGEEGELAPCYLSSKLISAAKKLQRKAIRIIETQVVAREREAMIVAVVPEQWARPAEGAEIRLDAQGRRIAAAPLVRTLKALAFEVSRQLPVALFDGFAKGEFESPARVTSASGRILDQSPASRAFQLYRQAVEFRELLALVTKRSRNLGLQTGAGEREFYEATFAQQNIWPDPKTGRGGLLREHAMVAYGTSPIIQAFVEKLISITEDEVAAGFTAQEEYDSRVDQRN